MNDRQKYTNLYPKYFSFSSQTILWPIEYSKIIRQLPDKDKKYYNNT